MRVAPLGEGSMVFFFLFLSPPCGEREEERAARSIQRLVLRQTVLQILHDLVRIVARFLGVLGPLGVERLGRLAPFGELSGVKRIKLVARLRLDLVAAGGLEV